MSSDLSHQPTSAEGSSSAANAKFGRGTTAPPDFLAGGGEMGALMRAKSWGGTPLGPPETWPDSLKVIVSICLNSRFPISLWWGPELVMLYNDAWRPILGRTKHPAALGRPGIETWPEIWDTIGPQFNSVLSRGEATWSDDLLLVIERNNYREEAYFTYSYSPIKHSDNRIGGVFSAISETTERVLGERRLRILRELAAQTAESKSVQAACDAFARVLGDGNPDLPFALLYLLDEDRPCASLLAKTGLDDSFASATIRLDHNDPWGVARVIREGNIQSALARFGEKPYQSDGVIVLNDLALHFGNLPGGVWPEPTTSAIVLPIAKPGQNGGTAGVLVAGINPRRALDDTYRGFFDLVAGHLATAVSNARAYEEERKRTEALAEIDRAKTQFFSNVSHEFRTPLTLMLGPLEDVLAKPETSPLSDHRSLLRLAHRNGVRLLKLVNTLLDFSRIEAGRVQVSFEPVDLALFTAELASNFHSAIEKAGLRLIVDCPSQPQPVYVDIDMWEKVVLNLISNAFKFTFEGEIAIVTRPSSDGSCAEVTIRDSGTGISPEELPHLFERFHRVEGARGRSIEGSGIGLALVQELVKLHGGSIRVASQVEQGSAFTVAIPFGTAHLPAEQISRARTQATTNVRAQAYVEEALGWLSDGAATGASEPPPPSTPQDPGDVAAVAGAEDPLILVADDNVDMRNYVQRILRAGGFRVEAVTDGKKALAAAGRLKPDLVLSDVMMPELDGFELLTAFRKDPELRDTPVLLLSARAGEEAKVEGLLAGADDYLIKPFSARELLARVGVKLQLARNRRERAEVLQAELARVTRLTTMGEMTASIAHEVNQPLMAIVTNADSCLSWLASDTPQIDEARMAAERIVRDGHRAGDIIKSIRALARKSRLEMTQLDMNDALAEVLALTRGELRRHDISLETELSGGFAPVMADRIQVQQVVLNLVMNGIEAMKAIMDRPRVLRVGSQIDGSGSVLIAVADTGTGTGLDPAKADRIFDAFFTTKPDGIGMGLSICRSIIEAHGGRIWASSNPPYGSVFQFSMPGITKGVSSDRLG